MKKPFWKSVIGSFNPFNYKQLAKTDVKEAMKYFLIIYSIAFLIGLVISVPGFIKIPKMLQSEFSKVDTFKIDIDFNASQDIDIPERNPFVTISNYGNDSHANLIINKNSFIYKPFPGLKKTYNISEFKDIKANSSKVSGVLFQVLIFLLPSIIILLFIFYLAKYLILALLLTVAVRIIMRLFKEKVKFKLLFNGALFAMTPLLIVDMIVIPLNIMTYMIPLFLFLIWFIVISYELVEQF